MLNNKLSENFFEGRIIVNRGIVYDGVPSEEELASCPGVPSESRMRQGRVAVIECVQEIPCNPCSYSCKQGAITIGEQITNLPHLDEDKCTGCGQCVANCPGLAITIMDKSFSDKEAVIDFPFEYLPAAEQHLSRIAYNVPKQFGGVQPLSSPSGNAVAVASSGTYATPAAI